MNDSKSINNTAIRSTPGSQHTNIELDQRRTEGAASPVTTLMCLGFGRRPWWPCCRSMSPSRRMPTGTMACLVDCTSGVLPWVTISITPNGIPAWHLNRSKELMRCHADSFVTAPPILTYDKAVQLTSPYSQANRGKPLSACLTDTSPGRLDDDTFTVTSNSLLKLV